MKAQPPPSSSPIMDTLSFSQIASAILNSVSAGGALHTTAATGLWPFQETTSNLSQVSLQGKLDLSLWRDYGADDDDEETDDDEKIKLGAVSTAGKDQVDRLGNREMAPPAPSPILAPLLGTKNEKNNTEVGKRMFSPVSMLRASNSLIGALSSGMAVPTGSEQTEQQDNNSLVGRIFSSTPLSPSTEVVSTTSLHKIHYGNKTTELEGVTPSPTPYWSSSGGDRGTGNDDGSARHHQTLQSGSGAPSGPTAFSLLRQQNQSLARKNATLSCSSSIISQQEVLGKPQEWAQIQKGVEEQRGHVQQQEQQQPFLPFLNSFIGSAQLSRGSQSQSRGEGDGRTHPRSAKKVEFTPEQIMAQQQQTAAILTGEQGEKAKVNESGKDGSTARSRSGSAVVRRPSSRVPTDILQEIRKMSLASQDAIEEKKRAAAVQDKTGGSAPSSARKFGKKSRFKRRKPEEVFTDKDRAAAVTLGSKDIKQSLKAKKKRDRKMRLSISFLSGEDYVVAALIGEAAYQMRVKNQPATALHTLNKALEIQPNHKGALVARSQCYLKLGDAESALKDAELTWDPTKQNDRFIQGLYQYAEALFQLGEFEKALIAFHRGHRIRKDQDGFRIGIQKCQEAIKRAIGSKKATNIPKLDMVLPLIQEFEDAKARQPAEEGKGKKGEDEMLKNIVKFKEDFTLSSPQEAMFKKKMITRELMGQLCLDKSYLKKFITRPEVINQQGLAKGLRDEACEALKYLEGRERFWRQQNPLYSRKNFTAMLQSRAHDVAHREKSISRDPSVVKYLQRRGSALIANASPPPSCPAITTTTSNKLKQRSSSEVDLNQKLQQERFRSSGREVSLDAKIEMSKRIAATKRPNKL